MKHNKYGNNKKYKNNLPYPIKKKDYPINNNPNTKLTNPNNIIAKKNLQKLSKPY